MPSTTAIERYARLSHMHARIPCSYKCRARKIMQDFLRVQNDSNLFATPSSVLLASIHPSAKSDRISTNEYSSTNLQKAGSRTQGLPMHNQSTFLSSAAINDNKQTNPSIASRNICLHPQTTVQQQNPYQQTNNQTKFGQVDYFTRPVGPLKMASPAQDPTQPGRTKQWERKKGQATCKAHISKSGNRTTSWYDDCVDSALSLTFLDSSFETLTHSLGY